MQPAEGTHLYFLDNEGVLFHESAQRIYHLNTPAAFIWCQVESGEDRKSIERALARTFLLSDDEARSYLGQAETLLQELGVIRGFERPASEQPTDDAPAARVDTGAHRFVVERHYRLLSSRIRIRASQANQMERVDPVLAHLAAPASDAAGGTTLDITVDSAGLLDVRQDGRPATRAIGLEGLAPVVKGLVWRIAIKEHAFFLDIHAGVVGDGRRCYLFPAAPGSGKSTLTAALVRRGFEYFSDEVALLQRDTLHVEPVPLAICVKHTGVDALSRDYPHLHALAVHSRGDGKLVRYLPPPESAIPPPGTARPVGAIVFPQYRPDGPTELEPMGKLAALESLMHECLVVDTRLDPANVGALLSWLDATPCYRLDVADLDTATAMMRALSSRPD
jgi:hypothetical protein